MIFFIARQLNRRISNNLIVWPLVIGEKLWE